MPNVNLLFCQYVKKTKNLTIQARNNQKVVFTKILVLFLI